jgi:DNA polymerase
MSRWSRLFKELTGIEPFPDTYASCDTSRKSATFGALTARDTFRQLNGHKPPAVSDPSLTGFLLSEGVDVASTPEKAGFPTGVAGCAGVTVALSPTLAVGPSDDPALFGAVFADFETRNTAGCDLKTAGAWRYAADPGTEIIYFGYRVEGEDHLWTPASNGREPLEVLAADPTVAFVSFAGFEAAVWSEIMVKRYGFPSIAAERWVDIRASCGYLALPRSLDKAAAALGLPVRKDMAGQRLVRSLSKRNRNGVYPELTPAIVERVAQYNRIDVALLEAIARQVGTLPAAERQIWLLDQAINQRGIAIDRELVAAARIIAAKITGEVIAEFAKLTEGLAPTQVEETRQWLIGRGCTLSDLKAETVLETLETTLPDDVRRVLEIRAITAATSLKKLDSMIAGVDSDGRARGLLQFHGSHTGRWTGERIQPQNLPRSKLKVEVKTEAEIETLVNAIKTGDPDALRPWGKPVDVLVSALRHALCAGEGLMLAATDFSMIECCVELALAGQHDKCELVARGVDIYRDAAATIFSIAERESFLAIDGKDLSPEQVEMRRVGKASVLGCGYGIGASTFYKRFCRHAPDGEALAGRIVSTYRDRWAPKVPQLWRDLERVALRAMLRRGEIVTAQCGVTYFLTERAGMPWLVSTLLNGKQLHYPNARLDRDKHGHICWVYNRRNQNGRWSEYRPYGGMLAENVVSALARELLVDRMFALEAADFKIVLTVHDEVVVEIPSREDPETIKARIEAIMSTRPRWAEQIGVPVKAEAWVGRRYRK